jgi:hypothetical protein
MFNYEDVKDISRCVNEIINIFVDKGYTVDKAKIALDKVRTRLEQSKVS